MTLIFMEGFDHFTSDDHLADKGWEAGASSTDVHSAYGRYGGRGVENSSSNPAEFFRKNIGVNKSTIYFGVAIKKNEAGVITIITSECPLIGLRDDSIAYQVKIYANSNFGLSAYKGDNTLLGSSADFVFPDQRWFYLEGKITISATVGVVELKVNGIQVLNLTSQDTKNGSDYIRYLQLSCVGIDKTSFFDDIYIDDAQFHGDCRIRSFMPDSISSTNNDFTASAGNKDECVDDDPPTDDTDYIVSDTLNHKQGFGITTGALGIVKAIQLNNFCRIDEAGTRKITPLIRSNSADYLGTETEDISADYKFEHEIWETDPDDSNPWTQTKLEAAEFGLEITT